MSSTLNVPESWLARMGGSDGSGWLTAFHRDAEKAVSDLLENRFYFGSLNPIERDQLLARWLEVLGDSEGFATKLDIQFETWIKKNRGRSDQPAASRVSVWTCLSNVIEFSAKLNASARLSNAAKALADCAH